MPIEPTGPVVVGVEGSSTSLRAVDLAAEEATARLVPLVVVHAHQGGSPATGARELVEVAVAQARAEHPGLSVAAEIVAGEPAAVLLDRSAAASLLVVGHRGQRGLHGLTSGSVAVEVLSWARVPVMVHRQLDTSTDVPLPRPVLLGVAGVEDSDPVVEFAFMEAALRGAPVHAMHVWSHSRGADLAGIEPVGVRDFPQCQDAAEQMLSEALAGWSDKYPDVPVCRTVRHDLDVPVALTAASRSAQLTVVGSSRRASLTHLLAGSACHILVHRARCPIAIVPVR